MSSAGAQLAVDGGEQAVEPPVVEPGDLAEGVGPLEEAAADRLGDFLGQQEQLLLVGVEGGGEPADQVFAGVVPEVEFAVLDLGDVGEGDADLPAQRPQGEALGPAQFPDRVAEAHRFSPEEVAAFPSYLTDCVVNRQHRHVGPWGQSASRQENET